MKILHICLAASYVEGYGYQENILPQMHSEMGLDVSVLTSEYSFNSKYEIVKREKNEYVNEYGIYVKSLKKSARYGYYSRFGDYCDLYKEIINIKPNIIFVHGGQFVALKDVLKYKKHYKNVKLYIDHHADYYNTEVKSIKQKIVQKIIYGFWMRKAVKYTEKFWGVTPWRCQYLNDVYGIPKNKIDLLVMGGDDRYINLNNKAEIRKKIRTDLNLKENDFVIVAGGKIDKTKNFHLLMDAVSNINVNNIKLILFGQANDDMHELIENKAKHNRIKYIGWLDSTKVYDYFLASDLAVFPGTHSVLWEQVCACGMPALFKYWEGMQHVNINGSSDFLYDDCTDEIKEKILEIYNDTNRFESMKKSAEDYSVKTFSYRSIAKRAIEME